MGQFHHNESIDANLRIIAQLVGNKGDIKSLRDELDGVGDKIRDEIKDFAESIAGAFGEVELEDPIQKLREIFAGQDAIIEDQRQQLADLQDKTQQLLGVIGYGNATPGGHTSMDERWVRIKHTKQIGAMVGCHIDDGDLVLESRGLWFISAQTAFDWFFISSKCETDVRIFDPDGNLYASALSVSTSSSRTTNTILMPVTTPGPGYRVQLYAKGGLGRGVLAGQDRSFLAADKRSQETD